MESVQITSERFSQKGEVTDLEESGPLATLRDKSAPKGSATVFAISGEAGTAPPGASFEFDVFGISASVRLVGTEEYVFDPAIASYDGGRPWVGSDPQERAHRRKGILDLLNPVSFLQFSSKGDPVEPGSAPHAPFASALALIRDASGFTALGPTTFDGQAVSEFTATLDLRHAQGVELDGLENLPTKVVGTIAQVTLFIAPSGVPVRTAVEWHKRRASFAATSEVTAVDNPVVVVPPPASATIALVEYERIEHAREQRTLAKLRRERPQRDARQVARIRRQLKALSRCVHTHRRHPHRCAKLVR